jgi:CHAD domain-containing protein
VLGQASTSAAAPRPSSAAEQVRGYLRAQLLEIERTESLLRSALDPDAVHDFRVAVRRMRSVLRSARALFDQSRLRVLRDGLGWLAREFGASRDLDVLLARLARDPSAKTAPLVHLLDGERLQAQERARAALEDDRYVKLIRLATDTIEASPAETADLTLEGIAAEEFRRLRRAAKTLRRTSTDDELHRVRIRAKRARYAAELAAPLVGRRARSFVESARRFQDVIGEHQDAAAGLERIRAVAAQTNSPEVAFAAGMLVERLERDRRRARRALPDAWTAFERRGRKSWSV